VGPFSALEFKIPTTQTEDLYIKSVTQTVEDYHALLRKTDADALQLENRDCDTGKLTAAGEYRLTDVTFAALLDKLASHDFEHTSPELKANIVQYFGDPRSKTALGKDKKSWTKIEKQLGELKASTESASIAPKNLP